MSRTEDWARFLELNIKNPDYKDKTNSKIDQCIGLIREGNDLNRAQKIMGLGKKEAAIIFELAHSRIKIKDKFEHWDRLWMDQYLASYSTPEIVCRYRSERITDFDIVEAGSGAGMQSIFLSRTNNSTLSVEIQPERHRMAQLNSMEYRTGKLKFVNGDIYRLSSQVEVGSNTLVFSDPARPRVEGERSMSSLIPSPESLVKVFGNKTENFVFDLPPQMKWENIGIKGEKEYLSIGGKLNRLTLYTGRLAREETSAVMLPEGIRYSGAPREFRDGSNKEVEDYILVPDISLVYAKLIWKIEEEFDAFPVWHDARRHIFTSQDPQEKFPGEQFEVLWSGGFEAIREQLTGLNAGRVFLRFPVGEDQYYGMKSSLESGLAGNFDAYIFKSGDVYFITRKAK